jgi:hypothetical protein
MCHNHTFHEDGIAWEICVAEFRWGGVALQVYVVKRLVKGLASGRQASRQGFATALTALLMQLEVLPTGAVLDLIEKQLDPGGSAKV